MIYYKQMTYYMTSPPGVLVKRSKGYSLWNEVKGQSHKSFILKVGVAYLLLCMTVLNEINRVSVFTSRLIQHYSFYSHK